SLGGDDASAGTSTVPPLAWATSTSLVVGVISASLLGASPPPPSPSAFGMPSLPIPTRSERRRLPRRRRRRPPACESSPAEPAVTGATGSPAAGAAIGAEAAAV